MDKSEANVFTLLNTLFSTEIDAEEKNKILEDVFDIKMTPNFKAEIADVTNLGREVKENGRKDGYEKGYKEDYEKGCKDGIAVMVATLMELGFPKDTILYQLCEKHNLTVEEAQNYL